jgi:hypothetical protein
LADDDMILLLSPDYAQAIVIWFEVGREKIGRARLPITAADARTMASYAPDGWRDPGSVAKSENVSASIHVARIQYPTNLAGETTLQTTAEINNCIDDAGGN